VLSRKHHPIIHVGAGPIQLVCAFRTHDPIGIVIGSTWCLCAASLAVAKSSTAVAEYLMGQYDNFLQFAGQKDGANRCAHVVQLLLANLVNQDVFTLLWLYSLTLPTLSALFSGNASTMRFRDNQDITYRNGGQQGDALETIQ